MSAERACALCLVNNENRSSFAAGGLLADRSPRRARCPLHAKILTGSQEQQPPPCLLVGQSVPARAGPIELFATRVSLC